MAAPGHTAQMTQDDTSSNDTTKHNLPSPPHVRLPARSYRSPAPADEEALHFVKVEMNLTGIAIEPYEMQIFYGPVTLHDLFAAFATAEMLLYLSGYSWPCRVFFPHSQRLELCIFTAGFPDKPSNFTRLWGMHNFPIQPIATTEQNEMACGAWMMMHAAFPARHEFACGGLLPHPSPPPPSSIRGRAVMMVQYAEMDDVAEPIPDEDQDDTEAVYARIHALSLQPSRK